MSAGLIIILVVLFLLIFIALIYLLWRPSQNDSLDTLLRNSREPTEVFKKTTRDNIYRQDSDDQFDEIKETHKKAFLKGQKSESEEERFFKAGMFSRKQQGSFKKFRLLAPVIGMILLGVLAAKTGNSRLIFMAAGIGGIFGYIAPSFYLDNITKKRDDEIMYYLPLVIEQLAIGVSSSLDIGPCIQNVVQMADERDTHNVVTELFKHCEQYMKSGVSLQEALVEIGKRTGHSELKHSFMALAQVARHGGEISRQLQELAEATQKQRETQIEAKIKRLELVATGPVAFVFFGFMIILLAGFGIQMKNALG